MYLAKRRSYGSPLSGLGITDMFDTCHFQRALLKAQAMELSRHHIRVMIFECIMHIYTFIQPSTFVLYNNHEYKLCILVTFHIMVVCKEMSATHCRIIIDYAAPLWPYLCLLSSALPNFHACYFQCIYGVDNKAQF